MIEIEKNSIIQGDAFSILKTLPDECINSVITSPPYFNLRDYGVEGQIGLERTYQEYIKKLIDIFDEVKRVLKKDGTCFVNLGDSYNGSGKGGDSERMYAKKHTSFGKIMDIRRQGKPLKVKLYPTKCLMMIPERFGIAMIDSGWILRNKLVWIKRNAMPESVQDRWKKAHEYFFFFVKSQKYYFDLDSIRTPHQLVSLKRAEYEQGRNALGQNPSSLGDKSAKYGMPARVVKLNDKGAVPPDFLDIFTNSGEDGAIEHYATYPRALISPLIKAGCPERGIVLDPFMGSGTTAVAARLLSRDYLGIELSEKYIKICEKRLAQQVLF